MRIEIAITFLVLTCSCTIVAQELQSPKRTRIGFPFQLERGMTAPEVAARLDTLFAVKHRRLPTSDEYKLLDLSGPNDSLFYNGIGPVTHLSYFLFKDTLSSLTLEFPRNSDIVIDTAYFIRSYQYKSSFYHGFTLSLTDSGFIMVISPRRDAPSISFFDMEVEERKYQYRRYLEEELAKDSVVIVVAANYDLPVSPPKTIQGDDMWSPSPLSLGEKVFFDQFKFTLEFTGIGVRKSRKREELTPANATLFLTIDHNGLKRQVTISADTDRPCSYCRCVGIAEDLPMWLVCASGFNKTTGTYQIQVNINRFAYH